MVDAHQRRVPAHPRTELLRQETREPRAPGLVAEIGGEAAGWVRLGPRTRQRRLARTRLFGPNSPEPWDDHTVWAVSCFSVRKEFRRQRVATALLSGAVDFARDHGARVIEGYPIDTSAGQVGSNELYIGALRTFLDAGFTETARPRADRAIVALGLR
ncbi:GNAT family N-acetyltransferase [Microbacterium sp. 18062]|uniref:GNAT family N-acetyltransferase n=1 Tax=Microbacterium sp. 18062 TaxID=2681410 RepID=UPI0027D26A59|nr:GNAT family N-acetyltransferase [Microbacterium sp. 18062]